MSARVRVRTYPEYPPYFEEERLANNFCNYSGAPCHGVFPVRARAGPGTTWKAYEEVGEANGSEPFCEHNPSSPFCELDLSHVAQPEIPVTDPVVIRPLGEYDSKGTAQTQCSSQESCDGIFQRQNGWETYEYVIDGLSEFHCEAARVGQECHISEADMVPVPKHITPPTIVTTPTIDDHVHDNHDVFDDDHHVDHHGGPPHGGQTWAPFQNFNSQPTTSGITSDTFGRQSSPSRRFRPVRREKFSPNKFSPNKFSLNKFSPKKFSPKNRDPRKQYVGFGFENFDEYKGPNYYR